jgi:hypothetical protein
MTFEAIVQTLWQQHATDAAGVAARLTAEALPQIAAPAHVEAAARLAVHVYGEHLGRWRDGVAWVEGLLALPAAKAAAPEALDGVHRGVATLLHCAGDLAAAEAALARCTATRAHAAASNRVAMLAVATSALASQKRVAEAVRTFHDAFAAAEYGPQKGDPAARALAVTGNNLAADLELAPERDAETTALMRLAAETARRYWEIAGGWVEVSRAEYRLAATYAAAGDLAAARRAAATCMAMCVANDAAAGDLLYAHEIAARVALAEGDASAAERGLAAAREQLARIPEDGREWYVGDVEALARKVAAAR